MTPVQRVTRYNLLLSDIAKCFKKAGDEEIYENLRSALEYAQEQPKLSLAQVQDIAH